MADRPVKPGERDGARGLSRRQMLRISAAGALSTLLHPAWADERTPTSQPASAPASAPSSDGPWWLGPAYPRARIVEVTSPRVLASGTAVDEPALGEVVNLGVQDLVGAKTVGDAWRTILGDARRITLKFNRVGASVVGTNDSLARALCESLAGAGYDPAGLTLVEVGRGVVREVKARTAENGWGGSIQIGEQREELAKYLLESEAIINVPLLKTHQIAGMSGALKNLSHAVIRRPARYHANSCAPYVAQIVSDKQVRDKLRLTVVNALRTVARGGPDADPRDVVDHAAVLFGFDPVALDAFGKNVLQGQRRQLGLSEHISVPYLTSAVELGLGRAEPHTVEVRPVTVG